MSRNAPIAKICAPRLFGVVPRTRLFDLLDANRGRPLIWLDGPPGAGKTTLVASYLEQRQIPTLWYQVDAGDADPAVVFHYLTLASTMLTSLGRGALPRFATDHSDDLLQFARDYFRALFSNLPLGTVIVLDNYQEAVPGAGIEVIARAMIDVMPNSGSVVCISRAAAPPDFAVHLARGAMMTVRWEGLRLTIDETRAITRSRNVGDEWLVRALHEQSDGWVAGITLMLERLGRSDPGGSALPSDSRESVFNYFATLLFDQLPVHHQKALTELSLLPYVTEDMAARVEIGIDVGELLQALYRKRMFVDRRSGANMSFVFHALFRDFLKGRLRVVFSPAELENVLERCVRSLGDVQDHGAVMDLLIENQKWNSAERYLQSIADLTLRQGRGQSLVRWVERLPAQCLQENPRLLLSLGLAQAQTAPETGIATMEIALRAFGNRKDVPGQITCLVALLKFGYVAHSALQSLDAWLDSLLGLLTPEREALLSAKEQLALWSVLCSTLLFVRPWHPWTELTASKVKALIPGCDDDSVLLGSAALAMEHCYLTGQFELGEWYTGIIADLAENPDSSPSESFWGFIQVGYSRFHQTRYEEAMASMERAISIARANRLPALLQRGLLTRFMIEFRVLNWENAKATLSEAEAISFPSNDSGSAFLRIFQARRAQFEGRLEDAADLAWESYSAILRSGTPHLTCVWAGFCAEILAHSGRLEAAREVLACGWRVVERSKIHQWWTPNFMLAQAYVHDLAHEKTEAISCLHKALALSKVGSRRFSLRFLQNALPHMFAIALERNVDIGLVGHLITLYRIKPPPSAPDNWPWPVRIRTLGEFEVACNDAVLEFPRKTPKKTLALLKALIAHGSADVPEQWLCDALWADDEADAAREALGITVLRLRKLLGSNDAITQKGGRVSLNRALVWVDAWRFDACCRGTEAQDSLKALDLYGGAFLPGDADEAWSVAARERLRGKFIHLLAHHGQSLEAAGDTGQALKWYFRGIDADPIVEAFHQGLMRCYQREGRHTEAISVYRRLRQTLSAVLGVEPGAASRALYETSMRICGEPVAQTDGQVLTLPRGRRMR